KQRYMERQVRKWKREKVALDAAGLDSGEAASKIRSWQEALKDFTKQTGLKRQSAREQIGLYSRSQASKTSAAAREYYKNWSKSIGAKESIKTLAKYYDVKYNDSPRYELLKGYARAVEKGDISPLVGFDQYEKANAEIQAKLVGQKTATGIVIERTTTHFIDRVIGQTSTPHKGMRQGVPVDEALDTLLNGKSGKVQVNARGQRSIQIVGKNNAITINPDAGALIQVNPVKK
ncbi:MAG: capsid protein, partial [Oscillospiraceae bacterium]|nr:capsid protein [Oscillospiraceae bacterium]